MYEVPFCRLPRSIALARAEQDRCTAWCAIHDWREANESPTPVWHVHCVPCNVSWCETTRERPTVCGACGSRSLAAWTPADEAAAPGTKWLGRGFRVRHAAHAAEGLARAEQDRCTAWCAGYDAARDCAPLALLTDHEVWGYAMTLALDRLGASDATDDISLACDAGIIAACAARVYDVLAAGFAEIPMNNLYTFDLLDGRSVTYAGRTEAHAFRRAREYHGAAVAQTPGRPAVPCERHGNDHAEATRQNGWLICRDCGGLLG